MKERNQQQQDEDEEEEPMERGNLGVEETTNGGEQETAVDSEDVGHADHEEEDGDQEEVEDDDEEEDDEQRMVLTEDERQWAIAIKNAIEQGEDLDPMSDFFYAQFALVHKGNVTTAVERAFQLQHFQREYEIEENLEYATRVGRDFQKLFPNFWMGLQFNPRDGNYVLALDMSGFYANVANASERNTRLWMSATYYIDHAMNPDFESIRQGPIVLAENTGFDWKKNFGTGLFRRLWTELAGVYPYQFQKLKNFHSGLFMNTIVSMSKAFIPKEIYRTFEMGCKCEGGSLTRLYMTPTVRDANERFLESTKIALEKRYANEASFSLS